MVDLLLLDQITFIYCNDLEKTADFYEDLLGFELIVDQGSCRIVRPPGANKAYLGYCSGAGRKVRVEGMIITWVTPMVDEWYAYLINAGVEIPKTPTYNREYGIYHFFFQDPGGYQLEIQSFRDRSWNRPV
jgi:catechol 2,3-dioxygenase-like lactoylglutathione lyase family enzyme